MMGRIDEAPVIEAFHVSRLRSCFVLDCRWELMLLAVRRTSVVVTWIVDETMASQLCKRVSQAWKIRHACQSYMVRLNSQVLPQSG